MAQGLPVSWAVALTMAPISLANVALLASTKRFDRYLVVLILIVTVFPAFVTVALGGMVGSSGGYIFAFVAPLFAILALGRRRATVWLLVYLAVLLVLILLDPIISRAIPLQPYGLRLIFWASNLSAPLLIIFFLLRYSERRRREAQARADELLTNAIPLSIATGLKRGEDALPTPIRRRPSSSRTWRRSRLGPPDRPRPHRERPRRAVQPLRRVRRRIRGREDQDHRRRLHGSGRCTGASCRPRRGGSDLAPGHAAPHERGPRAPLDLPLELRIGLASGPVVGGVIGQRRLLFDLWGDTANTAARMQSSGVPGRIRSRRRPGSGCAPPSPSRSDRRGEGHGAMTTYLLIAP